MLFPHEFVGLEDPQHELDPITLEVLWNAFKATADMMGITVWRTAYSTIVRDSRDCSAGLCDARGRLVAQADLIPSLSGAMHLSLKLLLKNYIPLENIHEGDVLILDHPYYGGTHTSDIILYSPIVAEGEIIAFAVSIAHHIDLGSMQATGIARATDLYQEGLLIPPLKLYERGELNETLWRLIEANVRYPKEVLGDLRAQIAANNIGIREIGKLVDKYGKSTIVRALAGVIAYGERMVRAEIEKIPDGVYVGEGHLDDDGIDADKPIHIKARVEVRGSEITYDLSESDDQARGNINSPPTAVLAGLGYATKCISDAQLPENEGTFIPIRPILREGSVFNPISPKPVLMRHTLIQRLADILIQTFAQAVPTKVPAASCGNTCTFTVVSPDGVHYSNLGGGFGATAYHDGMSAIQVHLSKCMGVTVEDIELTSGSFIERFELRKDSGGPGEYRGGLGVRQDVRVNSPEGVFSVTSDAETTNPNGLQGGLPGLPGRKHFKSNDGLLKRLYRKSSGYRLKQGEVVRLETPGGGGYGDPLNRPPQQVLLDVLDGFISPESALDDYGVVINDELVDADATGRKRAELRQKQNRAPRALRTLLEGEA